MKNMLTFFFSSMLLVCTHYSEGVAQECESYADVRKGKQNFLEKQDFAGKVAYRLSATRFQMLPDGCQVITRANSLEFIVNNNVEIGTNAYLAVQVIRFQQRTQSDQRPTFERKGNGWLRAGSDVGVLAPQAFRDFNLTDFIKVHSSASFDDSGMKGFGGVPWHAQLKDTDFSTFQKPVDWVWDEIEKVAEDDRALVSNRVYQFSPGTSGISFVVSTMGTSRMLIRTFSPVSADFTHSLGIELQD